MANLELPKRARKKIDPFKQEEADRIIAHLYSVDHWPSQIYGALFFIPGCASLKP